ncbi:helicase HerA domain-containing protein [Myxosarcina sp. GI1(2024)]
MQTWAFEWEAFLTKPNHRRQKYLSFQAAPTIPLMKTQQLNQKGMMFLTRELNTPIYLDIANEKNHTGIFATSGAGKSNMILETILENVIYDQRVVLFDFPRPDGTSTYTVLIPLLQKLGVKAAYHDVRKNTINIIEMPDLRSATDEQNRRERW